MNNYIRTTIVGVIAILLLTVVLWSDFMLWGPGICPGGESENSVCALVLESGKPTNRLGRERSPYLLQHAKNPVDWYPWGEEAFEKARREDKPIFLSIGYSTCHWCHVMEHECFEDSSVAALMNEAFVSIKVDREERPDIDNIYMTVCQMMTGAGGWPLTIIMTPEKKPFFAGTYIPKENAYGRMGMLQLVPKVSEFWKTKRQEAVESATQIAESLHSIGSAPAGALPDLSTIQAAVQQLKARFDEQNGGFGREPKFPSPHNLMLLLRYWKRTGDSTALGMVESTLQAMRRGGVYDHIGFGLHRYSTDAQWLLPHFEKMLYDQALLVMALTECYQATRDEQYALAAQEILTYVLRDMSSSEGAFWSAEDADSEGEEGKFYVWGMQELRQVLSPEDANLFIRTYNILPEGNFVEQGTRERTGSNIPHLKQPLSEIAAVEGMTVEQLESRLGAIRETLFAHREKRIHPYKDDKVLTDWNGLMIAAMSKAARAFDRPDYAVAAGRASEFVSGTLRGGDGRLMHRYRDGEAGLPAHLDDYAFMVWGLIELYETTFEVAHLNNALALNTDMITHFWDDDQGGFFFTAGDGEVLLARQKETYDGAIPSGNSVAFANLLRLARFTGDVELERKAERLGIALSPRIASAPSAHCQFLQAVDFLIGPSFEIVICGSPGADDMHAMMQAINGTYLPNKVVLFKPAGDGATAVDEIAGYTRALGMKDGKATAYVCRGFACQLPTNDPAVMLHQLSVE